MSRRSFPSIDPAALRDHADEARVERVWDRIERDRATRPAPSPGRARASTLAYLAVAAALGAFGAGLLLGKVTWDRRALPPVATAVDEKSLVEVLAAGTQLRTFPLQGGGRLTLSAGTTVEVERSGSAVTLSLLQGEASIESTGGGLTIVAGDARINTQSGSLLSVRRNADDLDVKVDAGSVSVTSPAGPQQLGQNEHRTVPLRAAVASAPIDAKPPRSRALLPRRATGARPSAAKTSNVPEWFTHYPADGATALLLLRKQGLKQAIDTAHGPAELSAIAELVGGGRDPNAEVRALERLVRDFPTDQRAFLAARSLAGIYEARGEPNRAREYREKVEPLAKNATTGGDALFCELIRREISDKTKAAAMAKEYLDKYPDGECRDEFERQVQSDPPSPAPASPPSPSPPSPSPPSPSAEPAPAPPTP